MLVIQAPPPVVQPSFVDVIAIIYGFPAYIDDDVDDDNDDDDDVCNHGVAWVVV